MRRIAVTAVGLALGIGWGAVALSVAEPRTETGEALVPLRQGDVLLFAGDSLTEHGERPGGFVRLVEAALVAQRPDLQTRVLASGKGWDTIRGLQDRFDADVLRSAPTVVVIEIGINDVCAAGAIRAVPQQLWRVRLEDLIARTRRAGARPVLTTLTVVGEKAPGANAYDALLDVYSEIIRDVGWDKACPVIDLQRVFREYLAEHNTEQRHDGVLTADGAHFNDRGNRLAADAVLAAFGLDPSGGQDP